MKPKKIISVIMALLMAVSLLPSLVFAAEVTTVELDGKLKIKGLASVGTELSANYKKVTPEGITDEDVTFTWSRKTEDETGTELTTEVGQEKTYTLVEEDLGSKIELKVTGIEERGFSGELKATTVTVVAKGETPEPDPDNSDEEELTEDGEAADGSSPEDVQETEDSYSDEEIQGTDDSYSDEEIQETGTESTQEDTQEASGTEAEAQDDSGEEVQGTESTETILPEVTESTGTDTENTEYTGTDVSDSLDTDDSAIEIENEETLELPENGAPAEEPAEEPETTPASEETEDTEGTDEVLALPYTVDPESGMSLVLESRTEGYTGTELPVQTVTFNNKEGVELWLTATVTMEDSSAPSAFTAVFDESKESEIELEEGSATLNIQPELGLTAGTYEGTVTVAADSDEYEPVAYPISFTVTAPPAANVTSDVADGGTITFDTLKEGYEVPAAKTVNLSNETGTADANLSIALDAAGQAAFTANLSTTTLAAGAAESAVVSIQPLPGLPAATYTGTLTISNGETPIYTYTITFTVAPADVFDLSVDPSVVDFGTAESGYETAPAAGTVTVANAGNTTITLKQPESSDFEVGALSAVTLEAGQTATFTIRPKTGLGEGVYEQDIVVASDQSQTSVKAVFTVTEAAVKLTGISKPSDITGLAYGTEKSAQALELPETVTISTTNGKMKASVKWDVSGSGYDPTSTSAQTFSVKGTVTLPGGVTNPDKISLIVSAKVSVNGRPAVLADPANNTISGISSTGAYTTETKITITATGAGMDNTTPGTGDTRYIPVSWKVLEARTWDQAPYTATFRMGKKGDYTMTVTFNQQKYDGSSWVNTGTQDTKQVSFSVSEVQNLTPAADRTDANQKEAVKTGDNTPIMTFVVILVVAVVCIVGIVVYRKKRQ